jgi:hypothetical protein
MLEESEEGYLGVEESVVVISTRMRGDDSEGSRGRRGEGVEGEESRQRASFALLSPH